jgi:hypothetical protein
MKFKEIYTKIINVFSKEDSKNITSNKTKMDNINKKIERKHMSEGLRINVDVNIPIINIDPSKKTLLIIDDSAGAVSFIQDDINHLHLQGNININDYNVLILTEKMCAFKLEGLLKKHKDLLIDYAIIDITLNGTSYNNETGRYIKYNGVDVFEMIYNTNPNIEFTFYTGNKMNKHIKTNQKLMSKFKSIYGGDLVDHIIFKTVLTATQRQNIFLDIITR